MSTIRTGSDLLVAALENEGVDRIFAVPGEENLEVVESRGGSSIETLDGRGQAARGRSAPARNRRRTVDPAEGSRARGELGRRGYTGWCARGRRRTGPQPDHVPADGAAGAAADGPGWQAPGRVVAAQPAPLPAPSDGLATHRQKASRRMCGL